MWASIRTVCLLVLIVVTLTMDMKADISGSCLFDDPREMLVTIGAKTDKSPYPQQGPCDFWVAKVVLVYTEYENKIMKVDWNWKYFGYITPESTVKFADLKSGLQYICKYQPKKKAPVRGRILAANQYYGEK